MEVLLPVVVVVVVKRVAMIALAKDEPLAVFLTVFMIKMVKMVNVVVTLIVYLVSELLLFFVPTL